jgi:hypothetical protein
MEISAVLKTPSRKLRNSKCGQGKKNYSQPPTVDVENRRPRAKDLL